MGEIAKLQNKTEMVIMQGDLSKLTAEERLAYVNNICEFTGLNPLTRPFDYINFQGKTILYARKECAEQLRKIHGVSVVITSKELIDDIYVVSAKATDRTGKTDESTGAVVISNLKGIDKANAMMKAETKAKRRVTLSICGLGLPDESEVDDMVKAEQAKEVAEPSQFDDDPRLKAIRDLVAKFAKLGVSAEDIAKKYGLGSVELLNEAHIADLKFIGKEIVNKRVTIADAFAPVAEQEF